MFNWNEEFGFIDGIQMLSFLMQCENNKDINNRTLLEHVHHEIEQLEQRLERMERKLDDLSGNSSHKT